MGQYHYIVNITKKQYINPHKIGSGLKIAEQIGWEASPSTALFILLDRKSTRLNSSHVSESRMPSSA